MRAWVLGPRFAEGPSPQAVSKMVKSMTTSKAMELWMQGFRPHEHGWRQVGAADDEDVAETVTMLRQEGQQIATFLSVYGKLTWYAREAEVVIDAV